MDISIQFNWPPAENSARVSFGGPTINDFEHEFRVGVVEKKDNDKVYWLKPGWVNCDSLHEIKFDLKRGDKVVVEKRKKESNKILTRNTWDTEKEWPLEANGSTSVVTPWTFH